jgi:predicted histidine transporter YuiF (NhaC family)
VQLIVVPFAVAKYSERTLITACSVGLIVCFAIFAGISTVPELYALCVPLAIMLTLFSVVNTAQIARGAPSEMKGTMLSADMVRNIHT